MFDEALDLYCLASQVASNFCEAKLSLELHWVNISRIDSMTLYSLESASDRIAVNVIFMLTFNFTLTILATITT